MDREFMRGRERMRRATAWTLETLQAQGGQATPVAGRPRIRQTQQGRNANANAAANANDAANKSVWTIPKPHLPGVNRRVVVPVAVAIGFVVVAAGAFVLGNHKSGGSLIAGSSVNGAATNQAASQSAAKATAAASGQGSSAATGKHDGLVSIVTFYPQNLPKGYSYANDAKALKPDTLYYSIKGPNGQVIYVTQQPLPASFDYSAFAKKFLKPDNFSTAIGDGMAGIVGPNLLGSIRTNQNTWVIFNSVDTAAQNPLESVMRSLR
jgi:hypothetical protein